MTDFPFAAWRRVFAGVTACKTMFVQMQMKWKDLKRNFPQVSFLIQPHLNKENYLLLTKIRDAGLDTSDSLKGFWHQQVKFPSVILSAVNTKCFPMGNVISSSPTLAQRNLLHAGLPSLMGFTQVKLTIRVSWVSMISGIIVGAPGGESKIRIDAFGWEM